jgi:hypothetical protein
VFSPHAPRPRPQTFTSKSSAILHYLTIDAVALSLEVAGAKALPKTGGGAAEGAGAAEGEGADWGVGGGAGGGGGVAQFEVIGAAFKVLARVVHTPHDCESFLKAGGLGLVVSAARLCRDGGKAAQLALVLPFAKSFVATCDGSDAGTLEIPKTHAVRELAEGSGDLE